MRSLAVLLFWGIFAHVCDCAVKSRRAVWESERLVDDGYCSFPPRNKKYTFGDGELNHTVDDGRCRSFQSNVQTVTKSTKYGTIRGRVIQLCDGPGVDLQYRPGQPFNTRYKTLNVFLGIPYAKAPTKKNNLQLQEWIDTTVRNAVLELLREMSQSKLAKLCPLSQPMLSNIINNRYVGKIGKDKCQEFGTWYLNYRKQNPEAVSPEVVPTDRPQDGRLTFHPTKELPMMRSWFHACRNPSRRTLQMYVDILNQGPVRQQERPKVVVSALKNWWKNEKQRERKSQRVEEGQQSPPKVKKTTRDEKPKETCTLQELSVAEPQRAAELNSKFPILNCSNQINSELDKFSKGDSLMDHNSTAAEIYKINHIQNNIITKCPGIVEDTNIFHKLHSVCLVQNNSIFDHFPGLHNKNYSNSLSRDLPATEIGKEMSNHSESEVDIDVGT